MARALIALGSNLGDRGATLDAAAKALAHLPQTLLLAKSLWIESVPVGPSQPPYLNGAAFVETSLPPVHLLDRLQQIENEAGRVRSVRWGPRTLDLDLLLYDDFVCDADRLTVPHPRMALRRFVLEPAAQIAAETVHPTSGWTIGELLARFHSTPAYLAMMGPPGSGKTRLAGELARLLGCQPSGCRLLLDPGIAPATGPKLDASTRGRPANSASPVLTREIEFLTRRGRLLDGGEPAGGPIVSDFWLAQSLAWWQAEHGDEWAAQVEAACPRMESMPARFLAVLDVGRSAKGSSGDSPSTEPNDMGPADDIDLGERLCAAMRALAKRPGQPPVIWLASEHWEDALAESLAALAG